MEKKDCVCGRTFFNQKGLKCHLSAEVWRIGERGDKHRSFLKENGWWRGHNFSRFENPAPQNNI